MNVRPLKGVFVPINKYKGQGRGGTLAISGAYASDAQILIFPAGLVSRLQEEGIRDLKWQKSFVAKAKETGRSIIPVYFGGVNTMRFYRWARWRKKLGLKFNFEQVLLPGELCRAAGKRFTVTFGKPINPAVLDKVTPSLRGEIVKDRVYALAPE
jgi:putative hemolysin